MWQTKYALAVPKFWEWAWIIGRAVKLISSLGIRSPCSETWCTGMEIYDRACVSRCFFAISDL
jgi:hypothetical protein